MNPECRKKAFRNGFSMVEAIIVTVLGAMMFFVVQAFFSHGVRSTVKGSDTLESIRAASSLFSSLKTDLGACFAVDTAGAYSSMGVADTDLPITATFSQELVFSMTGATATYRLEADPAGGFFVKRTEETLTSGTTTKSFGVLRMKRFEVLFLNKMNKLGFLTFSLPQIVVQVVVDSSDPRFPAREVKLTSVFCSSQLSSSNWNPVMF